jgi:AcrR family transcriptional regulator
MNEKFYNLKKEKQDRMINGAMEVFAKNGYQRASTDDMVKVSEVSKGLWFHYFENKMGLYNFVVSYGVKYALLELSLNVEKKEEDFFAICEGIERAKVAMMEKYPYLPLLLLSLLREQEEVALESVRELKEQYLDMLLQLQMQANTDFFRKKEHFSKLMGIIDYTRNGILEEYYYKPVFHKEGYLEEVGQYLRYMKSLTYR